MATHKTMTVRALTGLVTIGALILTACGGNEDDRPPSPAPITTPTAPTPLTTFSDGSYVVGPDVAPGTYHTEGPVVGSPNPCTWDRLADTKGNIVIAHDSVRVPATVVIVSGDAAFKTTGCQPWNLAHGK
jgi:hypothetical protein